jgi:hypothetical protein
MIDVLILLWLQRMKWTARRCRFVVLDDNDFHSGYTEIVRTTSIHCPKLHYLPHSTHIFQPLDVSLFALLATSYSQGLDEHIRPSEGLTGVTKRNLLDIFCPAWQQAFAEANISSGRSKTGLTLHPFGPAVVMGMFADAAMPPNEATGEPHTLFSRCSGSGSSNLTPKDWCKI